MKNNHQPSISPEGIAISLSLRVVLPRSPFDSAPVSYSNTSCNSATELVLRSRMSSQSQVYLRAEIMTDIASPYSRYSEDMERKKVGELDDTTGRRNSFPTFVEEEDLYDGGDQDNNEGEEEGEEEEDMPFAWVDHSVTVTRSFNVQSKIGGGVGGRDVERERLLAEGKSDLSCPIFSLKSAEYSYNMPPSLASFPDAPWYESGSAVSFSDEYCQTSICLARTIHLSSVRANPISFYSRHHDDIVFLTSTISS